MLNRETSKVKASSSGINATHHVSKLLDQHDKLNIIKAQMVLTFVESERQEAK